MEDYLLPNPPIYPESYVWSNRPLATIQTQEGLRSMAAQYGLYPPTVQTLPNEILINQDYALRAQQANFAHGNFPPPWGEVLPQTWSTGCSAWLAPQTPRAWQPQPTTVGGFGYQSLPSFAQSPSRSAFDAHDGTVLAGGIPTAPMFRATRFSMLAGCGCKNKGAMLASSAAPVASTAPTVVEQPPTQASLLRVFLFGTALGALGMTFYNAYQQNKPTDIPESDRVTEAALPTP